jgi:hypothetical protein
MKQKNAKPKVSSVAPGKGSSSGKSAAALFGKVPAGGETHQQAPAGQVPLTTN